MPEQAEVRRQRKADKCLAVARDILKSRG